MESLLNPELLRTFCAVVEAGELKKAAATLFRSQAAVSMQIKRLEQQLDVRLLERSNQGIALTDAGRTLLGYAGQILRLNNATLVALSQRQLTGRINFGIPTDYAQDFLTVFMPILMQDLPQLEARICCDRSRNLRQLVGRGELDLAIVAGEDDVHDELMLWSENLIWCAPKGISLEDREMLPVALYEDNCIVRDRCAADLKRTGIPYIKVFGSPVLENIAAAIRAGLAVSLLPESLVQPALMRALPATFIRSTATLNMNMICSPVADQATFERLAECLRRAGSKLKHRGF
ncbi:MAG: LysR family transcriptional regulator [Azoarcus sp.]|nr:LysR family transcriptional regulator [Azoarcus sp.]